MPHWAARLPRADMPRSARAVSPHDKPVVHLLAFTTPHSCVLLQCWLRWMGVWMSDPHASAEIKLTVQSYLPDANFSSPKSRWRHVLLQRISCVYNMLEQLPVGSTFLFTDLDVVPFRPLTTLLPLPAELTYMREPPGHGGRTGRHIGNSGLFGVRVNPKTRKFFGHLKWLAKQYPRLMDQDLVNWLLLAKPGNSMHHPVQWATWPNTLVTGLLGEVTSETVAYHAIFANETSIKLAKLSEAFRRRYGVGAPSVPPCEPSSHCIQSK